MNKFFKFLLIATLTIVTFFITYGTYHAVVDGGYFTNASLINSAFIVLGLISLFYLYAKGVKAVWSLSVLVIITILVSCNYAKSNQQVLVSDDCGMNWKMIPAGQAVPKGGMNPCYMRVVIPNFPMQGDSKFIANLKDKVRATTHIDYDYSITNPLAFIKQAKYLGKANADVDSDGALDPKAFEGAENMVIDKRIREVAKELFLDEDIVELDQSILEDKLLVEANKILEPLGVHLNFIALTFDLDEQTRQAIDVATAMKIYQSKGMNQVGVEIMIQRAGAPKLVLEQTPTEVKTEK